MNRDCKCFKYCAVPEVKQNDEVFYSKKVENFTIQIFNSKKLKMLNLSATSLLCANISSPPLQMIS